MRNLIAIIAVAVALTASPAPAAAYTGMVYVPDVRVGNTVTWTNTTDVATSGYSLYLTRNPNTRFASSDPAFSYGTHVSYQRTCIRRIAGCWYVSMWVADGFNLYVSVPAHSVVWVTGS